MDAESKQLAAQAEAQSLLISALMLAIGKEGGVAELVKQRNESDKFGTGII